MFYTEIVINRHQRVLTSTTECEFGTCGMHILKKGTLLVIVFASLGLLQRVHSLAEFINLKTAPVATGDQFLVQ
jgi:hypothetical protein